MNKEFNSDYNWDLKIAKWLYKLSLKYPEMKEEFHANGFGPLTDTIKLYGDLHIHEKLSTEIKSLEAMFRDKSKRFRYESIIPPSSYSKSAGVPMPLSHYFDRFRKELRDISLDNLLGEDIDD